MREIVLEINNEYVKQSSRFGGVQGAGNVTGVKLCFDQSWDGFTKTLIWFNAYGENPVFQALTVDMAEDKDYRIYTATIPKEPLEFWGSCSLVIEGFKDSALAKSVRVELEVEPCPDTSSAQQSADPTPTLAQQLQREIEGIKTDIDKALVNAERADTVSKEAERLSYEAELASKQAIEICQQTEFISQQVIKDCEQNSSKINRLDEKLNGKESAFEVLSVTKGGTGASTEFRAASALGRTTYNCTSVANTSVMTASISNFPAIYGCTLYLHVWNGNTVANVQLSVNGVQAPIYTTDGNALTGTEIGKNQVCEFTLAEAANGLPMRWILINPLIESGVDEETLQRIVEEYLNENPPEVDLSGYATTQYVDSAINAALVSIPTAEGGSY